MLRDLATAGYPVENLDQLMRSGFTYRGAMPVLLHGFVETDNMALEDWLARTLTVPWARGVAEPVLLQEFRRLPGNVDFDMARWAIGNALDVVATPDLRDELERLALDRRFGTARQMRVLWLGRHAAPESLEALLSLTDDPDVAVHAASALDAYGEPRVVERLKALEAERTGLVQKNARKSLARIAKRQARGAR